MPHFANARFREPGEHVDARGIDDHRRDPADGVFNNFVVFDQYVAQNSLASVVPELASDEPDQKIQTYICGADRNYTGYCNPETDALIDRQSAESDPEKRRKLVWDVERRLAEDAFRPVLLIHGCNWGAGTRRKSGVAN